METAISLNYPTIQTKVIYRAPEKMDYSAANKVDTILKAINHTLRLEIITLLEEKKRVKVADIYKKLGLDQSATSLHLSILRHNNIVKTERSGRIIYYSLNYDRIAEVVGFINKIVPSTEEKH